MERFLPQDRRGEIRKGEGAAREIGSRDKVKGFQLRLITYIDF